MEECLGRSLPLGFQLRRETEDDFEFIVRLYASTRAQELAPVPWPEEAKQAFLRQLNPAYGLSHHKPRAFAIFKNMAPPAALTSWSTIGSR